MLIRLSTTERRAEIVQAAVDLTREASPAFITTGDIAAVIGVTQGAVFKHFPTKEAIWTAVLAWVRDELLTRLSQVSEATPDPVEALAALFRTHVDFVVSHPGVPRLIFHELQLPDDSGAKAEVRALLQAYRGLLLARLAQARATGAVAAEVDTEAAATAFVGLLQGLVMQSMMAGRPEAMRQHAEGVLALYLRGLGGRHG